MAEVDYIIPEEEYPVVPNVSPVMILKGSDYEIGYQYMQQMFEIFGPWALKRLKHDFTDEEIAALKAYHEQIEKYTPEFLENFKGRVAGAAACGIPLTYEEVLLENCRSLLSRFVTYPGEESDYSKETILPHGCSGMAAWGSATKDGKLHCAASADHPIFHHIITMIIPDEGNSYIFPNVIPPSPGIHPAMNNKGLSMTHHAQPVPGDSKPGYGVPVMLMEQHTLRFADNVEQALEMQRSYPLEVTTGGLWVDVHGGSLALECRNPLAARTSGDFGEKDFIYATNTELARELEPFMKKGVGHSLGWPVFYVEHGGWNQDDLNSVRRNLYLWNMMHNYHGEIDLEFVKMMWRFPSPAPEYPTLEEAEVKLNETLGKGWDSHIGNLGICFMALLEPDDGNNGKYYVCDGSPAKQAEPLTQGVYFFPVDRLFSFVEIQLTDSPMAVAMAAKKRSQYDLYDANKELRKLGYADAAYAPLNKIFDDAAIESQKGDFYLGLAAKAQGNDQVNLHAKAARCFYRCQAYAKHVYESLVPQPASPSDLGLREWKGDWGEWETVDSCPES